jgi:hypothetical protein
MAQMRQLISRIGRTRHDVKDAIPRERGGTPDVHVRRLLLHTTFDPQRVRRGS